MIKNTVVSEELQVMQFKDLMDHFEYFLLDAYGVFWESAQMGMLPRAKETMAYLISHGKKVGILSNSTQLASKEEDKLNKHGVQAGVHYHFLLTSGQVARDLLISEKLPFEAPQKKYWLFGSDHPRFSSHSALFQGTGYRQTLNLLEADFIYIPIPHLNGVDQENPEGFLKDIAEVASKGIPVLCANPDLFAHEGLPSRLVVRQGTIAHLLEAQGASVYYIGKPFSHVYEQALSFFSDTVLPEKILMIGDTPETDIRGGRQMGMATALVTKTGIMKERIKEKKAGTIVSQLPKSDQPHYIIESFAIHGL